MSKKNQNRRPPCPKCDSLDIYKAGKRPNGKQGWQCQQCSCNFTWPPKRRTEVPSDMPLECPYCGESEFYRDGTPRGRQRFECRSCGRVHTPGVAKISQGKRKIVDISLQHGMPVKAIAEMAEVSISFVYQRREKLSEQKKAGEESKES